jgi:glutamate-1-semialdehyde aminotransferase
MRIFGGASTFSKMASVYPSCMYQTMAGAVGQNIIAGDGRAFFDTVSALGSQLIDYENKGSMMSLSYVGESTLADMLAERIPCIEMVRYGCNGADATEGAIRYARKYTRRKRILSVGYHSCQSPFTWTTPPALGCINGGVIAVDNFDTLINSLSTCKTDDIAAVIIEPVMLDIHVYPKLKEIRDLTKTHGIVLIFDEIITGFRFKDLCVTNYHKIQPDLILLGKALGGGYPLSIIGGSRDIMNCPVFHSYTFAGFPLSIDSAIKTVKIVDKEIDKFWEISGKFMDDFNRLPHRLKLNGYNTRGVWTGTDALKYTFWQQMLKSGYLIGPAFFPRIRWTEENFSDLLSASRRALEDIEKNHIELEGEIPQPIFKRN